MALWLGALGFGGGFAVLSQLRALVVDKRRWYTEQEYADTVSVAVSLPGSNGANFFTQLGLRAGGLGGATLATVLFLLPSAALMCLFAAHYERVRAWPRATALFAGMSPAVVAIIGAVAFGLVKKSHRWWQLGVAALVVGCIELDVGVLEIVLLATLIAFLSSGLKRPTVLMMVPVALVLPRLLVVFLRIGISSVAGGLAMIPMLDHEVVGQLHWLTPTEFSDAVTLGQVTPGPVAIAATFIGYRVAGVTGALLATVGTFAPPLVANVAAGRSVAAFSGSPVVARLLAVLGPVTAGIVVAAAISVGRMALHGWLDVAVLGLAFVGVTFLRVPALLALVAGATARVLIIGWR